MCEKERHTKNSIYRGDSPSNALQYFRPHSSNSCPAKFWKKVFFPKSCVDDDIDNGRDIISCTVLTWDKTYYTQGSLKREPQSGPRCYII